MHRPRFHLTVSAVGIPGLSGSFFVPLLRLGKIHSPRLASTRCFFPYPTSRKRGFLPRLFFLLFVLLLLLFIIILYYISYLLYHIILYYYLRLCKTHSPRHASTRCFFPYSASRKRDFLLRLLFLLLLLFIILYYIFLILLLFILYYI